MRSSIVSAKPSATALDHNDDIDDETPTTPVPIVRDTTPDRASDTASVIQRVPRPKTVPPPLPARPHTERAPDLSSFAVLDPAVATEARRPSSRPPPIPEAARRRAKHRVTIPRDRTKTDAH